MGGCGRAHEATKVNLVRILQSRPQLLATRREGVHNLHKNGHVSETVGIFLGYFWDIFGTCLGHVWDIFGTLLGHFWDVIGTTQGVQGAKFGR